MRGRPRLDCCLSLCSRCVDGALGRSGRSVDCGGPVAPDPSPNAERAHTASADYGFEYSDEEPDEEDVDIENQYYNAKGKLLVKSWWHMCMMTNLRSQLAWEVWRHLIARLLLVWLEGEGSFNEGQVRCA
eukprot:364902-Chlamydomonas_euryale.AAC.4